MITLKNKVQLTLFFCLMFVLNSTAKVDHYANYLYKYTCNIELDCEVLESEDILFAELVNNEEELELGNLGVVEVEEGGALDFDPINSLSPGIIPSTSLFAQQFLEGVWQTGEDNTKIETYYKDGAWFGKIISSDNPKAEIGRDILRNLKKKGDLWEGDYYKLDRDKKMKVVVKPTENKLLLEVSIAIFTKELEWLRTP